MAGPMRLLQRNPDDRAFPLPDMPLLRHVLLLRGRVAMKAETTLKSVLRCACGKQVVVAMPWLGTYWTYIYTHADGTYCQVDEPDFGDAANG
jgi:hypothetical protein